MPTVQALILNGLILHGISKAMKMKHNNNNSGFTLIEVLLYIAIFSSIIMVIVALAINSIAERQKNEVFTAVNYQGEAAMEIIEQDIHEASSIASPNSGVAASAIELNIARRPLYNPTIFSTYNDGSTNHLEISQGSPSVNTYLTNSYVSISNLSFTNEGLSGTNGSIQISFSLSYKSTSTLKSLLTKILFMEQPAYPNE